VRVVVALGNDADGLGRLFEVVPVEGDGRVEFPLVVGVLVVVVAVEVGGVVAVIDDLEWGEFILIRE